MHCITNLEAYRDRLERALRTSAALVTRDTVFLPIFQRIEAELERLNVSASALDRARQITARQSAMR